MKSIGLGSKGKSILITILMIAVIFTAMQTVSADDPVLIYVMPSSQTVGLGQTFTVDIYVDPNGNDFSSVATDYLHWDYGKIELKSVAINQAFWPGGATALDPYVYKYILSQNGIPVGETKTLNHTTPYLLSLCNQSKTYVNITAGTYSLKINGHEVANVTGASLTKYDLAYWIANGADCDTDYVNVSIKNLGGSTITNAKLFTLDSMKLSLGASTTGEHPTAAGSYATLTFKANRYGLCNFYIDEATAILGVNTLLTQTTNGTINIGRAPAISSPSPVNQTTGVNPNPTISAFIADPDGGSSMSIWLNITNADGGAVTDHWTSASNGTKTSTHSNTIATFGKRYNWTVQVSDGTYYSSKSYWFQLRAQYVPGAPTSFTANGVDLTKINISWTKASGATNRTVIIAKQDSYPSSRTD